MWIPMMVALAAWAATRHRKQPKVVAKASRPKGEPTIGQRTFTDKTGLGYVLDPVVQRPKLHAGNGLGDKATHLEHERQVKDVQQLRSAMGF